MSITNPRLSQKYPKQMQEFDRLLAELDSLIPKQALKEFRLNSEPAKLFQLVHYRLRQSRKEFDALLFFAVCFGMLKSGKSTLVNLLAGHPEASPARFGIDTTLRPCLVLAGTKNEITTFQMMDSMKAGDTDEAERGCFNAVIDHLRGMIESEDELAAVHHVVVRRTSLTEDNIIKALTSKDIGIEPLITVVRLDGPSELLRSGIALLDVPGMDSYKMGTAVPRYIELLERCDLLLFIQSTISPLNQGAASMLKQLVERSRGSPVWLIQNRFEAQNWRNPKGVAEQDSELTEVAKNQLGAEIGIKPHLIFAKQVNLGKAYDARFQQEKLRADIRPDDLLEESGFPEIERELFTKINEERLDIQLANCLNQLNDALQKNRVTLAELEKWIADEAARLFSFITEFDGVIARFSSKSGLIPTLGMDNQNESVAARIKQRFETYRDQWKALIVYGLEQWKSSIRDKMIGDEFNDELYRRIDELYIRGIEQVFSLKGAFGEDLAEIFRQVAENSDSFRNLLSESQEILARHECDPLDTHYPPWVPEATVRYLNISVARPAKVKGGRHGRVFFKVKVEVDTCHGKIDEATTKLQAAADEYANSLGKEIPKDFRQYRDAQLAVFFIEQLRSRKEKKQKQAEEIKTELETLQKQIAPLRSALDRLHRFADDFRMKC